VARTSLCLRLLGGVLAGRLNNNKQTKTNAKLKKGYNHSTLKDPHPGIDIEFQALSRTEKMCYNIGREDDIIIPQGSLSDRLSPFWSIVT